MQGWVQPFTILGHFDHALTEPGCKGVNVYIYAHLCIVMIACLGSWSEPGHDNCYVQMTPGWNS